MMANKEESTQLGSSDAIAIADKDKGVEERPLKRARSDPTPVQVLLWNPCAVSDY